MKPKIIFCLSLFALLLPSCRNLKNNILFATSQNINSEAFEQTAKRAESGYIIQPADRVAISVFTNKGERIIDPNREFAIGNAPAVAGGNQQMMQNGMFANDTNGPANLPFMANNGAPASFLVQTDGCATLPLIGKIKLAGLSLAEADKLLQEQYDSFYEDPFIMTQYLNKRVIIMGALGDKVIPLRNENMTLVEVLALAGDFQQKSRPDNVRIIRGDLKDPAVQLIDFTTIEGLKTASLLVEPNDIIYVEPRRRIDRESIADFNSLIAPVSTVTTLALTIFLLFR